MLSIPSRLPECCIRVLARPGWFDVALLRTVRLQLANPFVRAIQNMAGVPIAATAIGNVIYFREMEHFDPRSAWGISLLAHELRHVEQYREQHGIVPYAILYTWEYVRRGYGVNISFEAEAYGVGDVVYGHLVQEFNYNANRPVCLDDLRPNPDYVLLEPAPALPRRASA